MGGELSAVASSASSSGLILAHSVVWKCRWGFGVRLSGVWAALGCRALPLKGFWGNCRCPVCSHVPYFLTLQITPLIDIIPCYHFKV